MSIADLNTLYAAAVAASDSGDYDTAVQKGRAVLIRLATMPNVTRNAGGGSQSLTFPGYAAVEAFIAACEKAKGVAAHAAGSVGIFRESKIAYAQAATSEQS